MALRTRPSASIRLSMLAYGAPARRARRWRRLASSKPSMQVNTCTCSFWSVPGGWGGLPPRPLGADGPAEVLAALEGVLDGPLDPGGGAPLLATSEHVRLF